MNIRPITRPDDASLAALAELLARTFSDPNSVLGLDRMQLFLEADPAASGRSFHVLVAEDEAGRVVGGSIFSYVPRSNCGFSEYLVLEPSARGQGLGRSLFDRRREVLENCAVQHGHVGLRPCNGLFIEVDSPERSPPEMLEAERESSIDVYQRLRIFAHMGFRKVAIPYVQPPLGHGKLAVTYLDLLFASWPDPIGVIPVAWILDTLEPIWSAWTPSNAAAYVAQLREKIGSARLVSLDALDTG